LEVGKVYPIKNGHKIIQLLIRRGKPWFKWKDQIEETLEMFSLSEYFHWTPSQIREIDEKDLDRYLMIMKGMSTVKGDK